jgi:sRNA-binding protein
MKTTKTISEDSRTLGGDLNSGLRGYVAGVLITQMKISCTRTKKNEGSRRKEKMRRERRKRVRNKRENEDGEGTGKERARGLRKTTRKRKMMQKEERRRNACICSRLGKVTGSVNFCNSDLTFSVR